MSPPLAGAAGMVAAPEVSQGWGNMPSEAGRQDGWIVIQLGYSRSLALSMLVLPPVEQW